MRNTGNIQGNCSITDWKTSNQEIWVSLTTVACQPRVTLHFKEWPTHYITRFFSAIYWNFTGRVNFARFANTYLNYKIF